VGGLLVYVMLFLPASSAAQLALDLRHQFLLAPILGVFSALAGVGLSFVADLPVGASIAVSACALFLLCWAISPRRRVQDLVPPVPPAQP